MKFGALRGPDGSWLGFDARPAAVKNFLAYTLTRLGVDHIDIYRPARLDPAVPIEDTIGAIADLVKAGYVRHIGLSEVGAETIRRAQAVHPIADLQIEYSLISRGPEAAIFPLLAELGIGVTAYGVLSRGLLSGSKPSGPGDFRAHLPRFSGENGEQNQRLVDALRALAAEQGRRAPRSWRSPGCSPRARRIVPGDRRAHAGAARRNRSARSQITLSPDELAPHRGGGAGGRRRRHPLRRAPDAHARQREVAGGSLAGPADDKQTPGGRLAEAANDEKTSFAGVHPSFRCLHESIAAPETLRTSCCIAGGGPAGMMLGFLLARAGVDVVVLEKHADFLRDFRGDTIHPSTLESCTSSACSMISSSCRTRRSANSAA